MPSPAVIFVYGTLKRGFCRDHYLHGQRFLGMGLTQPNYRMFHCGTYPGLIAVSQDGRSIQGELWAVDEVCLARLDQEEGVSERLYSRDSIELAPPLPEGIRATEVEAYFYLLPTTGFPDCGDQWT